MAGIPKPAVAARRDARARLAARHAKQMERLARDEEDMTVFVEAQTVINAAATTLNNEISRAGLHRDQRVAVAVAEFHARPGQGSTMDSSVGAHVDSAGDCQDVVEFGAALDQAADDFHTAALAAAKVCNVTITGARGRQGHALHRLRERGMTVSELATATGLPNGRIARLIKHRALSVAGLGEDDNERADSEPTAADAAAGGPRHGAGRDDIRDSR
ncbi:hypothetical protein ACWEKT_20170 [Nocardia takedensis]|uniref:hypothetical protein n=1 Tax=Nocardia takedensis TaxID=259390 RepID=UPI0014616474|nr:hypothetical protein [Nocardia takedensis]